MTVTHWQYDLGAKVIEGDGTRFRVWAPNAQSVAVLILSGKAAGSVHMKQEEKGYYSVTVPGVTDGDRYLYQLDGEKAYPDPASRYQPCGVHECSQVVDPMLFEWSDNGWPGIPLEECRIYEIHVGTFTTEGTFDAAIKHLDYLADLGITALEVMPVAQCPGTRNWGYDGVFPYAVSHNYGGPDGFKRLINACHKKGLAVILDVVYNHIGPEGNYLPEFGPYFTDKYRTPWGKALNFDEAYSDPVVDYFMTNAMFWINEYHIDALRLDAVDWIFDQTPKHFLQRLAEELHAQRSRLGRAVYFFAENDTNDARLINPHSIGGYGIDAQWCDNFHHALRTLLTGETTGYYEDYGQFSQLVKTYTDAFVFTGEYSHYRKRRHGGFAKDNPTSQFVVFTQNHDQVGNRKCGDRLAAVQAMEKLLLAAGVMLLSPYIPLLFMGEEYGERANFHYFIDHSDPELIELVRKGKNEEHASGICEGEIPDPQDEAVFLESKIDLTREREEEQGLILEFYRKLMSLRKELPGLKVFDRKQIEVTAFHDERVMAVRRKKEGNSVLCLYSFGNIVQEVTLNLPQGNWEKILDSSATHWKGQGEVAAQIIPVAEGGRDAIIEITPFTVLVYTCNHTEG